ncbi:chromatin modification-related protein [Acrasis kona]|uniref:Chromatin modification-related protein n=1 Tax=Acrasis kona TaxID=1008807 RepID=A0AAW2ZII3_9EUKA
MGTETKVASNANNNAQDEKQTVSIDQLRDDRKKLEHEILQMEQQLFSYESSYLEDTWPTGNIVRGFDGLIANKSKSKGAESNARKSKFKDTERLFSYSSESSSRAMQHVFESDRKAPSYIDFPIVLDTTVPQTEGELVEQTTKCGNVAFIDTNNPVYQNVFSYKRKEKIDMSSDSEN